MLVIAPNQIGAKSGGSCVPTASGHWPSPDANTQDRLTLTEPYPNKDLRTSDNPRSDIFQYDGAAKSPPSPPKVSGLTTTILVLFLTVKHKQGHTF